MKHLYILIFSLLIISFHDIDAQEWELKTGLEEFARHHPVTWSHDGYGFAVTGVIPGGQFGAPSNGFFRYDPDTDSWEQLDDFPGPARGFAIGDYYDGKAYIGFGSTTSQYLDDLWMYDHETEEWTELSSCTCIGRQHPTLTINEENGKIYVGMGNNSFNLKDWWEYDIETDSWTSEEDFPGTARHHPYQFSIDGYTYSGLGDDSGPSNAKDDWYRFDPDTDTWDEMATAPGGRIAGQQFEYKGYGYVIDGDGLFHRATDPSIFWQYHPDENKWVQLEPHPGASLWAPGSFIIDGVLYLFGGQDRFGNTEYFTDMWATDLDAITPTSSDDYVNSFKDQTFTVFPNPVTDKLRLASNKSIQDLNLEFYDMNGILINAINASDIINMEGYSSGVYIMKIMSVDGKSATKKIIKK